ncbi:alpha/beta hydrolase fold domain-containing protein [Prosthecobacter sp.]|uniref:alpha/beta hydrolase fold domain-containing protein n=1 Tax=Prosthecobacter sp. TaxID=1965333 RepID=UPI002ABC0B86|nr:alpha/beta hydrolase fold domain-containing protein [Prosthecobacter sp.]MDZ4403271.1 alpha/beta hydrolase fold domain-containing protein [Prosthecobacter sp.]
MIYQTIAATVGLALCAIACSHAEDATKPTPATAAAPDIASRMAARGAKKNKGGTFDPKTYLAELSAEGTQRGYQEFAYKQTPQGELRIYFKMPESWSENDKRPVMVFFFGGGWSGGSPFVCVREADHFTKNGVVVGLADYRACNRQGTMLDKCAEDARSAVRWVRANCAKLGADPARLIVGGGSAGGHIAACTAAAEAPSSDSDDLSVSCTPNALLLYYPVASLVDGSRSFAFQRLLGDDLAKKLSPAQNVTKLWPKTVMFSGTADIELANGILLHNQAKAADVTFEMYLAEGRGHGIARTKPRDFAWLNYATDFFTRIGIIDKQPAPEVLSGDLKKYNGEPVESITISSDTSASRPRRQRGVVPETKPTPAPAPIPEKAKTSDVSSTKLELTLGKKGQLLLEETFDGDALSQGWTGKTGGLSVADGVLHASMKSEDGRLGLFNREQPMQNAAIQIDFKFAGARGINISCNPPPGELSKHGHLFSVMITPRMWNITEHNDKSDPNSRSKALASAATNFEQGQWYTLLLETKGADVVARIEGKEPLRVSSSDFSVKKPGIEFRVSGRDNEEVVFDNLRAWELN